MGNVQFDHFSSFRFFLRMNPRVACHYPKVGENQFPKLEIKLSLQTSLSFQRISISDIIRLGHYTTVLVEVHKVSVILSVDTFHITFQDVQKVSII